MAKTVIPYDGEAIAEVFVRMRTKGERRWKPGDSDFMVAVRAEGTFPGGTMLHGYVRSRDVVAMVVDDARYAFIEPTARGTSATFETPEAAAQMLEGLGWRVEPPPAGRRAGVRYWNPATVGAHGEIADAHVEPIGEPRFYVIETPFGWEVRENNTTALTNTVAGPFDHRHLAQAEADDLNNGDPR